MTLKANITMPKLVGANFSGASHGTITGFRSNSDFNLAVSGASSLSSDIEADNVEMDLSGASTVTLSGAARDVDVQASGASHLDLEDFAVESASVSLSATVNVKESLDRVNLSGASHLRYIGNPRIGDLNTSDASTIKSN